MGAEKIQRNNDNSGKKLSDLTTPISGGTSQEIEDTLKLIRDIMQR